MSAFLITRAIFIILVALLILADIFFFPIHFGIYIFLASTFLTIIVLGSSFIRLQFFIKTYNKFYTEENEIAITFDDGPHQKFTPIILDLLTKYEAKGTFFCIGKNIETNKEIAKEIARNNHEIGNHSFSHSNFFSLFGKNKVKQELILTNNLILETTGAECKIFRPPYGVTNPPIASALKKSPMKAIGWSIRSFDTTTKNPERVINRVISKIKPGAIILLHDNRKQTIEILEAILLYTKNNNYKCISLSDSVNLM